MDLELDKTEINNKYVYLLWQLVIGKGEEVNNVFIH
jgi:hypothetical protein